MIAETKTRLFKDKADPRQRWAISCWCMPRCHYSTWDLALRLLIGHRHAKRAAGRTYTRKVR